MAFRRDSLLEIGGFNPIYLRAGDDVDVCWRMQARGWRVGFAPAALVWHRHRSTFKGYWRQQRGYGEGEAWLAPHHPHKFPHGQAIWRGRIYSPLPFLRALSKARVNSGPWGLAAFPSIYQGDPYLLTLLPHRIEWMIVAALNIAAGAVLWWFDKTDLALLVSAIGVAALLTTTVKCFQFARASDVSQIGAIPGWPLPVSHGLARLIIAVLHLAQPLARAVGRVSGTLAGLPAASTQSPEQPQRSTLLDFKKALPLVLGRSVERHYWSERWAEPGAWLSDILNQLRVARVGRAVEVDDGWQPMRDLSIEIGRSSWLDIRSLEEDHGSGRRLGRIEMRLRLTRLGRLVVGLMLLALTAAAVLATLTLGALPWWSVAAGIAAVTAVAARWAWMVARLVAATERAIVAGSAKCGFQSVESLERQSPQAVDSEVPEETVVGGSPPPDLTA